MKRKQYLLVDGYNIINAWETLKPLAKESLGEARDKLIDILANYQGYKKNEVIVVFDAQYVKGNKGSVHKNGRLWVVYTKEAETADSYIERVSNTLVKDYDVRVATSDGLVQIIIMGNGAKRVSATELYEEIKHCEKEIKQRIEQMKPVKLNRIMDNLDPKTAAWFEEMRKQ